MRMLLIVEYITPVNEIASIRWTKLSKYLAKNHGIAIDVLTNEKKFQSNSLFSKNYLTDPTLKDDALFLSEIRIIRDNMRIKTLHALLNSLRAAKSIFATREDTTRYCSNDGLKKQNSRSRSSNSLSSLRDGILKAEGIAIVKQFEKMQINYSKYDLIVSSCGPRWTHQIASRIKRDNPSIAWIADYRDSLVFSNATDTAENRSFAKEVTSGADCIVTISKDVAGLLFLDKTQRVEVVTNGYDPEEMASRERRSSDKFELAYTGVLYNSGNGKRDLTPLFRALKDLIDAGDIVKEDVVVRYAGGTEDIFFEQTRSFSDISFDSAGLVSRDEALEMQSRASLLIFSTWNTKTIKGMVTGKVFEYLSSGVPIVGVCSGDASGSIAKTIIEKSNAGFCYEEASGFEDYARLTSFLRDSYVQWKTKGITSCSLDAGYVSRFGYPRLAKQMAEIIRSITNKRES